jgi:small-conductance mechanosensitive channel/CRP-like cAMP-binding protein
MAQFSALIDGNFTLINRIFVLLLTLLFFMTVFIVRRVRQQEIRSRITTPIALSLFGFLLLYCETALSSLPSYRALLEGLSTVIALLCLAQLIIYLTVDIYIYLHIRREAPSFLRDTVRLVVYLAAGIISLRLVFKIDLSAIAVTTTVITAAIAFALQNTLANAMSGLSIQTDTLLSLHTWIGIKEKNIFGEIVNVGFRYTTLRNTENNLVMVPNSVIMQNVVIYYGNLETDDKPAILVDVMLGYDMPPERAKVLLMQVMQDEPEVLRIPEPQVRLYALNDSGITYQLRFLIVDPSRRIPVQDLIYTRVWYAVNRQGYSFPFPHRQIITAEARPPYEFSSEQVVADIKGFELFAMLDDQDIQLIAAQAPVKVFGPGEVIVHQGDSGSSLFVVLKGELEVLVDGTAVGGISRDSFFGEMSLLTGSPRTATVRAICEVWLAEVTKELMEPLLRAHPQIMENLSSILAERERSTKANVSENASPSGTTSRQEFYLKRLKQFFGM